MNSAEDSPASPEFERRRPRYFQHSASPFEPQRRAGHPFEFSHDRGLDSPNVGRQHLDSPSVDEGGADGSEQGTPVRRVSKRISARMQRAQQRAAIQAAESDADGESDANDDDGLPSHGDPPSTPEEAKAESIAAQTVLQEDLMAPSLDDRKKVALQYIATLAPRSQGKYLSRTGEFQVFFRNKFREADVEARWDEMREFRNEPSGLGVGLEPREWWWKGVLITPERVESYIANLTQPIIGPGGMKKRKSYSVVEDHVKALVFTHQIQCIMRGVRVTHDLRTPSVKTCLRAAARQTATRAREEFLDRQEGAVSDGYSDDQLTDMLDKMLDDAWHHNMDEDYDKVFEALSMRAMSALQHSSLGRGDTTRGFNLCDLFALKQESIGPTECWMLGLVTDRGKQNKEGRKQMIGLIQHKKWGRCAFGALGLLLYYRWEVLNEPFPDTRWRLPKDVYPDWAPFEGTEAEYERQLRQDPGYREAEDEDFDDGGSDDSERPQLLTPDGSPLLSPVAGGAAQSPAAATSAAADGASTTSSSERTPVAARSPTGNQTAASEQEMRPFPSSWLSESDIARLGHWVYAHMFLSYLTNIPPEALLVMSGFPPLKQAYHLPRFHVDVPDGLPMLFAKADSQLAEVVARHALISKYKGERKAAPKKLERDMSAEQFLRALTGPLRKIVYQHLALVYDRCPDHPLCNHVLMDPDAEHAELWLQFVKEVVDAEEGRDQLPDVVERPEVPGAEIKAGLDTIATDVGLLRGAVTRLQRCLGEISLIAATGGPADQGAATAGGPDDDLDRSGMTSQHATAASAAATGGRANFAARDAADQETGAAGTSAGTNSQQGQARRPRRTRQQDVENVYSLNFLRKITQVAQAYYLFKVGLDGKQSIDALKAAALEDRTFKYADREVGRLISGLQVLVKFVENTAETLGLSAEEAIIYTERIKTDTLGDPHAAMRSFIDACPTMKKRKAGEVADEEAGGDSIKKQKKVKLEDLIKEYSRKRDELGHEGFKTWLRSNPLEADAMQE
ncbi:hypothetical protein KFL_004310090 [Klebsormidium nitens]|uniref:Ndc10 domain-containing protein n=1 Tax=Klebsormidium nitens TaxID=105231 RepID=A0A1Y1IHD8_KLENI|nr:hypothetical protein KFL_004310090 [Klebsormidium nitens]|eukprot:GAQ88471.1 hypothetical protein KFL_004310090 [Klebsormidium nitens]